MYCSICGNKLDNVDHFCSSCGKPIKKNEENLYNTVTDVEALEIFVGPNANFYLSKWGIREGEVKKVSSNFAAFFLGILWITYRKMYGFIIILFLVFLAIDFVAYSNGLEDINKPIGMIISLILLFCGNYFYYKQAKTKIEKIRRKKPNDFIKEVERAGGTSYFGFFIFLIIFGVYLILTSMMYDYYFPEESIIEFGYDMQDGEIIEASDTFQPFDTIFYSFYFSDYKGGEYKIVIEKVEGNTQFIYDSWEKEVPPDWEGLYNNMMAPGEVGIYEMKIIKDNQVSARGTFYIAK